MVIMAISGWEYDLHYPLITAPEPAARAVTRRLWLKLTVTFINAMKAQDLHHQMRRRL